MGLSRLILFLLLFAGGYWLWRKLTKPVPPTASAATDMRATVRCQHCQVYLPRTQALQKNNQWYCCTEHAAKES